MRTQGIKCYGRVTSNEGRETGSFLVFALAALVLLTLAGCVSSEKFYDNVSMSRETAYRQWKDRKERKERSDAHITGELMMEDCLKLALGNNKVLQKVIEEKEIARGERLKSYSAILPTVALTGDWQEVDEVASMSIPSIPGGGPGGKITMGDIHTYSVGLRVTQPIFDGWAMPARINAGRLFSLLTDQTVRSAVQDVIYAASHSYYDVLLDQHLVQISADAVRSAQAHLEDVKRKRQGGVASDFDVLRAEVELSNFQAELIRNKNTINIAKANLLKVMGVSQDSEITLVDELAYNSLEMTMEKAVEVAYRNRPDLFDREFNIKYQKELLKTAYSRYWPTISTYYQNTWSRPDPHNRMEIEWGHMWQAGFTATLPIFDGFSREGEIIQQKARVKQAQIDLIDAEETALFELTKALLSIQDAQEFVESQRLNLTRAQEGLRLAEVGYREGTNTQVEMIDAQAALTTARANYYQAIYSHIVAKLDLQKAMGTLMRFEPVKSKADSPIDQMSPAPQGRDGMRAAKEEDTLKRVVD